MEILRKRIQIHLLELFNKIIDKNQMPQEWETGMVINIHKKEQKVVVPHFSNGTPILLPRCGTTWYYDPNVLHCEIPYVSLIAATRQHQPSDIVKYSLLSKWGYDLGIKDIIPQPH